LLVTLQNLLHSWIEGTAEDAATGQYDRQSQLLAATKITVTRMMFPKHGIGITERTSAKSTYVP